MALTKAVGCITEVQISYDVYYSMNDIESMYIKGYDSTYEYSNENVYELCLKECKFMGASLIIFTDEDVCACIYDSYYVKDLPCTENDSIVYEIENPEKKKIGLEISKTLKKQFENDNKTKTMGIVIDTYE